MRHLAQPMLLAVALCAAVAPATAGDRSDAWLRPAPTTGPPPSMILDADVLRPPLPGVPVPTDPRDGIRRGSPEREAGSAELARRRAATALAGGDDIFYNNLDYLDDVVLDVASNGDLYMGIDHNPSESFGEYFQVYRSTTNGESWTLIGTFSSPGNDYDRLYTIEVVEGVQDRVFATYMHRNSSRGAFDVRVAYAPLGTDTPSWTIRTVMNSAGVSFLGPDMADDSIGFSDYYLYMVCAGLDGNGDDVFFCRSTDQGNTWSTPYRIAELTSSGNLMYSNPHIEYGSGGELHVAYSYTERLQSTFDDALVYRKGTGYGASAANWTTTAWGLEPTNDEADVFPKDIVVSPDGTIVSVLATGYNSSVPRVRNSNTSGDTWTLPRVTDLPLAHATSLLWDAAGSRLLIGGAALSEDGTGPDRAAFAEAPASDPQTFGIATVMGDVYPQYGRGDVAVHPDYTRGVMLAYTASIGAGNYRAAFDAEWRDGPGFPNTEAGFPIDIPYETSVQSRTSPAVVDLDGDDDLEIVFANTDGRIFAFHHDATPVVGWPVDVGETYYGSPAAIGALNIDGEPSVVVGDRTGSVHAYAPDGSIRPGFPVDLGTGAPVYVCIAATGPPNPRSILAVSGDEQARIDWKGRVNFKWGTLIGTHIAQPAVGDVDGDGDAEIVYSFLTTSNTAGVHVTDADLEGSIDAFRGLPARPSAAVSLGDLDGDGDLEITVPLENGQLYVLHHDLSDVTGFPFTGSTGTALTRVAIDQFLGTFEPELIFAELDWTVNVLYADGTQQSNYPVEPDTGWFQFNGPITTSVDSQYGNYVVLGSRSGNIWAYRNTLAYVPDGWPKDVGDQIEMTPAAGDIDLDGRNEIVFLGDRRLHVVDVGVPNGGTFESWPMDGANPRRSGCSECFEDIVTSVESDGAAGGFEFRMASPNPARGYAEFAFRLDTPAVAELAIYDVRGRRVRLVDRSERAPGAVRMVFDGRDDRGTNLARGTYLARLVVDHGRRTAVKKFAWVD